MPHTIKTPVFKNEAEEADWWPANQDVLTAAFEEAAKDGTLRRGPVAQTRTEWATIQLGPQDAALAREQAALRGMEYEGYVRKIIHNALLENAAKP